MLRHLLHATPLVALLVASSPVAAQNAPGALPAMPPGQGQMPPPPTLTKADVERLILVIPELAKQGAELQGRAPTSGPQAEQDLQKVQSLLTKYDYTLPDFFMHMSALVSTFLALSPDEFEKRLPSESSPEVRRILDDPSVSAEDKQALRAQITQAVANKEQIRAQLTAFATEENKKVVRAMLPQVKQALDAAEVETQKARAKALDDMLKKQQKGPRREAKKGG